MHSNGIKWPGGSRNIKLTNFLVDDWGDCARSITPCFDAGQMTRFCWTLVKIMQHMYRSLCPFLWTWNFSISWLSQFWKLISIININNTLDKVVLQSSQSKLFHQICTSFVSKLCSFLKDGVVLWLQVNWVNHIKGFASLLNYQIFRSYSFSIT